MGWFAKRGRGAGRLNQENGMGAPEKKKSPAAAKKKKRKSPAKEITRRHPEKKGEWPVKERAATALQRKSAVHPHPQCPWIRGGKSTPKKKEPSCQKSAGPTKNYPAKKRKRRAAQKKRAKGPITPDRGV